MQIFANGKQRFYSFMEFYVRDLKIKVLKFDHSTTLKFAIPPTDPTDQYHVFFS